MKEGPNSAQQHYHNGVKTKRFGIVVAQWNSEITFGLRDGAVQFLTEQGVSSGNIQVHYVSGAFELPLAAQYLSQSANVDAVICIGCLIKGETPHFHYISEAVTLSLANLSIQHNKPFSFGVLTVNKELEAQDRCGGKFGNKGQEAAEAAFNLLSLKENLKGKA